MRNVAIGALICLLLITGAGVSIERHSVACELLPVLSHRQVAGHVFFGHDITAEQTEDLVGLVSLASDRITEVYGAPDSTPRVFITADAETARRWGANETASMHRMPWRSCIVVGPQGHSVDVMAHEWLHAEIQHRVGFMRLLKEVPIWFDEGAALTLDYREPFLPSNIALTDDKIDAVRNLSSARDFFSGNTRENYQAARMAVIPLIDGSTFLRDLERIATGERFEEVFSVNELPMQSPALSTQ